MKTDLTTVPSFVFVQDNTEEVQPPIHVKYWSNAIELNQGGNEVMIDYDELSSLFREIKGHLPQALARLKS